MNYIKKRIILIALFFLTGNQIFSQSLPVKNTNELNAAKSDSSKVLVLYKVIAFYRELDREIAIENIQKAIAICEKNNQLLMKLKLSVELAGQYLGKQQFAEAYSLLSSILKAAENIQSKNSSWLFYPDQSLEANTNSLKAIVHHNFQILMHQTSNWKEFDYHFNLLAKYTQLLTGKEKLLFKARVITGKAYAFLRQEKLDSALLILQSAEKNQDIYEGYKPFFHLVYGSVLAELNDYDQAKKYLLLSLSHSDSRNTTTRSAYKLSQIYRYTNNIDSAYFFAKVLIDTLKNFGSANYEVDLGVAYDNLYQCFFLMNKKDSASKYARMALYAKDSLYNLRIKNLSEFQQLSFNEQRRLEAIETDRKNKTVRWVAYIAFIITALIGFIAVILFRNAKLRKKTNAILFQEKKTLELTLDQLKSTQAQLVQSEKMASLGELTAGIAHEIQNPLNFVNNFSDLSNELVDEMNAELAKGDITEAQLIAKDVKQNLEKIAHHGKRADAIVKGMLQHSRTSSGKKEPTDINQLCDEYLRLAYHGLRAKDKSFNAILQSDFEESIGLINIVPQDIGRVLLNLITNAFYTIAEKSKLGIADYEPMVKLNTKKVNNNILINIIDNGNGIPPNILDKIFQPFFTTKPTGDGTGLGLSLSYDIVKAHGGELRVISNINEGSTFTIQLPFS